MKKIYLIIALFAFFASCSSKYGIVKSKAYVRESIAGTVRVDESGRPIGSPIRKQHLIYIETDTSRPLPQWQTAWVEQQPYSVRPVEVPLNQVIGKTGDGKDVVVSPKQGNRLWQLVLTPKQDEAAGDSPLKEKIEKNPIVLTGTWKEKAFTYTISKEEPLQRLEFQ